MHLRNNEARDAHGYHQTYWIQFGLAYACGIYTAQQQGIIRKTTFFARFWRHHYFDFIGWAKRSVLIAGFGGIALGTYFFGHPTIAINRCFNKFQYYFIADVPDVRASDQMWSVRI